jgi:hypothetical protein
MLFATSFAALMAGLIFGVIWGLVGLAVGMLVGGGSGFLIAHFVEKWRHLRVWLALSGLVALGAIGCLVGFYFGFVHGWMQLFER